MQAMPMINQTAPVNEAVASRAARSTGKGTNADDKFSPALQEACNERDGEELAGAAMVSHSEDSQQQVLPGNGEVVQGQPASSGKGVLVAPEEALTVKAAIGDSMVTVSDPIVEGDDVSQEVASTDSVVADVEGSVAAVVGKDKAPVASINQLLNGEMADERTRFANGVQDRQQQNVNQRSVEELVEPVQTNVVSAAAQVGEAQKGIGTQVVDAVSRQTPGRQLNIQPLEKVTEAVVNVEAGNVEKTNGNRPLVTDPRFASLLNKPEVAATLRQQQGADSALISSTTPATIGPSYEAAGAAAGMTIGEGDIALSATSDPLAVTAATSQQAEGVTSTAVPPQVVVAEVAPTQSTEAVISLKDGSSLPESRVVQQTIDHLTLHARGDSSSVTVRLHPEELGELQLRMVMEGDQLKVHLHAQTQQVQEVLERNFPRLRDALQDQGVTVEDFQVSVDSGERGDQQSSEQREFVANRQSDHFSSFEQDSEPEVESIISAAAAQADGRGVSLRV